MGTSWSSEKASTQLWFSPTSGTAQIMPSTWRESSFWKTEVTSLESKRGCSFKEERVAQGFGGAGDPVEGAAGADEFEPGGDHAQGIGALADEAAGQGAGLVAELIDDVLDAFAGFGGYIRAFVDHPGYGLGGDSGGGGDLFDGRSGGAMMHGV